MVTIENSIKAINGCISAFSAVAEPREFGLSFMANHENIASLETETHSLVGFECYGLTVWKEEDESDLYCYADDPTMAYQEDADEREDVARFLVKGTIENREYMVICDEMDAIRKVVAYLSNI